MTQTDQLPLRLFSMSVNEPSNKRKAYSLSKMSISKNHLNDVSNSTLLSTTTTTNTSCGFSVNSQNNMGEAHSTSGTDSCISTQSFHTTMSNMLSSSEQSHNATCRSNNHKNIDHLKWWQKCQIRQSVFLLEKDLEQVISESPLLQKNYSQNELMTLPVFHRSEIITGSILGSGGFSDVLEVIGFQLDERLSQRLTSEQNELRERMAANAIDPMNGEGRYAIKQLQSRLIQENSNNLRNFELAAADLAVEIAYLSRLHHPNILAIRGLPYRGIKAYLDGSHDSYFFICDRLMDTLEQRMNHVWNQPDKHVGIVQKAQYALQLAEALRHLHEHRIIFRDLKPQNIGFAYGQTNRIILFDFGLCRELPMIPDDGEDDPMSSYEMSGVGTRRYMAPEVAMHQPYNLKADVYGWSMIFWEMLTTMKPYAYHTVEEHMEQVCQNGLRPMVWKKEWPLPIRNILRKSWSQSAVDRYCMEDICNELNKFIVLSRPSRPIAVTITKAKGYATKSLSSFYKKLKPYDQEEIMSLPCSCIAALDCFDIVRPLLSQEGSFLPHVNPWNAYICDTNNTTFDQHEASHHDADEGFEVLLNQS